MIAERDFLLEEEDKLIANENEYKQRNCEEVLDTSDNMIHATNAAVSCEEKYASSDDELEWEDFQEKEMDGNLRPEKRCKRKIITSDDEDDDDDE
jgi:hypothetical protein